MIVHDVEQRSPEWFALRAGIPTASEFGKMLSPDGSMRSEQFKTYALTLAAERFAGDTLDANHSYWMERGRVLEESALELYEFVNDVETTPVGFITDDKGVVGCSPDALVLDDGLVEVKCLKGENHLKTMLKVQAEGKAPMTYRPQCQGQLWVTDRHWVDLAFYHPELPFFVAREWRYEAFIQNLERVVPDLLSRRAAALEALYKEAGEAA